MMMHSRRNEPEEAQIESLSSMMFPALAGEKNGDLSPDNKKRQSAEYSKRFEQRRRTMQPDLAGEKRHGKLPPEVKRYDELPSEVDRSWKPILEVEQSGKLLPEVDNKDKLPLEVKEEKKALPEAIPEERHKRDSEQGR